MIGQEVIRFETVAVAAVVDVDSDVVVAAVDIDAVVVAAAADDVVVNNWGKSGNGSS